MFHQPNWSQLPSSEFERRVAEVAAQPSGVLDGSYSAVRHVIWPRAECVVWLDLPRLLVTSQVFRRTGDVAPPDRSCGTATVTRWRDMLSTDPTHRPSPQHGSATPSSAPDTPPRPIPGGRR